MKKAKNFFNNLWIWYFSCGGFMIAEFSIQTNMALFLEQNKVGDRSLAGLVISFVTIGGKLVSIFLARLDILLRKFLIVILLLGMSVGFLVLSLTTMVPLIIVSVFLIGTGAVLAPMVFIKILDSVESHQADQAIAITMSFMFFGQFVCPLVHDNIRKLLNNDAIQFQFVFLSVAVIVTLGINVFLNTKKIIKY